MAACNAGDPFAYASLGFECQARSPFHNALLRFGLYVVYKALNVYRRL